MNHKGKCMRDIIGGPHEGHCRGSPSRTVDTVGGVYDRQRRGGGHKGPGNVVQEHKAMQYR